MSEQIIPTEDNPLYSVSTVAKLFDVDQDTVRQWIREDKIKANKILGRWRILHSEVVRVANEEYGGD